MKQAGSRLGARLTRCSDLTLMGDLVLPHLGSKGCIIKSCDLVAMQCGKLLRSCFISKWINIVSKQSFKFRKFHYPTLLAYQNYSLQTRVGSGALEVWFRNTILIHIRVKHCNIVLYRSV